MDKMISYTDLFFYLCGTLVMFLSLSVLSSGDSNFHLEPFNCSTIDVGLCDRILGVTQFKEEIYVTTRWQIVKMREDLTVVQQKDTSLSDDGVDNILAVISRESELLLTCQNDIQGSCELRDLSTLELITDNITGSDVVYPEGGPIVGWTDEIPGEGTVLTTALSTIDKLANDDHGYPLPLVSIRRFPSYENSLSINQGTQRLELLADDNFVRSSYLQPVSCFSDAVEPLYGFTAGNHRYILKEHTNEHGDTHVKLIRLCKDARTFRSYAELPIECQGNRSVHFSGDRAVYVSSVAHYTAGMLYVTFTEKTSDRAIAHTCEYSLESIDGAFTKRRKECLEGLTKTTEIPWYGHDYCPTSLPKHYDISQLDDPDYCYDEHFAQPLGGRDPIIQNARADLTVDGNISAILVVSPTYRGETMYLMGDTDGNLHKITADGSLKETVPVGFSILKQNGLLLHVNEEEIYVIGDREIILLPLYTPTTTVPTTTTVVTEARTPKKDAGDKSDDDDEANDDDNADDDGNANDDDNNDNADNGCNEAHARGTFLLIITTICLQYI